MRFALMTVMCLPALQACDSTANAAMTGFGKECLEALRRFEAASDATLPLVRKYGFCISSNAGTDDCDHSFRRLHEAQREFGRAAAEREAQCTAAQVDTNLR